MTGDLKSEIIYSLPGIISFIMFLIFYRKLKPSRFWGKLHPAESWALGQICGGSGPRLGFDIILPLLAGLGINLIPILSVIVYGVSGIIMMILAHRIKAVHLAGNLQDDLNKNLINVGKNNIEH